MPKVDDIVAGSVMPRKKFFRSRAHCNPLSSNDSFKYEITPDLQPWHEMFPLYFSENSGSNSNSNNNSMIESSSNNETDSGSNSLKKRSRVERKLVRHLDIGMGFGGLTLELATLFPDDLVLGMEIRSKVCEYVKLKIDALRQDNKLTAPLVYQNASCLRTNCMRYLPNYFYKGQMKKIFFCFPDPHFKAKNHRRRIVSYALLSEYAYILAPGGRLYTITDVEELHKWHVEKASSHECFRRIGIDNDPDLMRDDPAVRAMYEKTEEGIKVERNAGRKFYAVFERLRDDEIIRSPLDELWT